MQQKIDFFLYNLFEECKLSIYIYLETSKYNFFFIFYTTLVITFGTP